MNDENRLTAEALVAGLPGKHRPSVSTGDGDRYIYIFGGEPNAHGTHPRHVAIMTDGETGDLLVSLSVYGQPDAYLSFDVQDVETTRQRIALFIETGVSPAKC